MKEPTMKSSLRSSHSNDSGIIVASGTSKSVSEHRKIWTHESSLIGAETSKRSFSLIVGHNTYLVDAQQNVEKSLF